MGFTPSQFDVGEHVQLIDDIRSPQYRHFAGLSGRIVKSLGNLETRGPDLTFDSSYYIEFDEKSMKLLEGRLGHRGFVQIARETPIPGRFLVGNVSTLLRRKMEGTWRA